MENVTVVKRVLSLLNYECEHQGRTFVFFVLYLYYISISSCGRADSLSSIRGCCKHPQHPYLPRPCMKRFNYAHTWSRLVQHAHKHRLCKRCSAGILLFKRCVVLLENMFFFSIILITLTHALFVIKIMVVGNVLATPTDVWFHCVRGSSDPSLWELSSHGSHITQTSVYYTPGRNVLNMKSSSKYIWNNVCTAISPRKHNSLQWNGCLLCAPLPTWRTGSISCAQDTFFFFPWTFRDSVKKLPAVMNILMHE